MGGLAAEAAGVGAPLAGWGSGLYRQSSAAGARAQYRLVGSRGQTE